MSTFKIKLNQFPQINCILLECTELPQFADLLRYTFHLPVYSIVTACNFYMSGFFNNPRFGINDWQNKWNGINKFPYN